MAGKKRPKVRKVWALNPKSRVKESGKLYERPRAKRQAKQRVDWFGDG